MQNIELFCGQTGPSESEKFVLSYLMDLLSRRNEKAVVLCNFHLSNLNKKSRYTQIDLFVATTSTMLQIEVKNYVRRVSGGLNGPWVLTDDRGNKEEIDNRYEQVLSNNQILQSRMSKLSAFKSYPHGAMVFTPQIPEGSNFSEELQNNPYVSIVSLDQLEELLNKSHKKPWSLYAVRKLADKCSLRRYNSIDDLAERIADNDNDHDEESLKTSTVAPQYSGAPSANVLRTIESPATSIASNSRLHPVAIQLIMPSASPQPQRKNWPAIVLLMFFIVAASTLLWNKYGKQTPAVTDNDTPGKPLSRPSDVGTAQKYKQQKDARSLSPRPVSGQALPVSERPQAKPAEQITCPANVERLGCNGRVGTFDAPQCPAGFHVDGESCARNG
ncbi:nuclease-related domain-containing protein [Herbaspirillum sp. meg3]|uniref:nuclease-related domain-containing protein n=1 Tax=Herbaspirillum sp. meg3 TaxID=2025949 RepID=UPI0012FD806F|nr:nuclease-related domain-containing protein [Herbaspirillum sp. meg3]